MSSGSSSNCQVTSTKHKAHRLGTAFRVHARGVHGWRTDGAWGGPPPHSEKGTRVAHGKCIGIHIDIHIGERLVRSITVQPSSRRACITPAPSSAPLAWKEA